MSVLKDYKNRDIRELKRTFRRMNTSSGFTLIEVSITVFIIAIVFLSVTPRISAVLSNDPASIARRLAGLIRSCREYSIMTHKPYRVVFDLVERKYYVETIDEENFTELKFIIDDSIMHRPVTIPQDLKIMDVITPVSGKTTEGTAYIPIFQDGLFPGAVLHFQDSDEEKYTLIFLPLTGRLRFEQGYLFQEYDTQG